MKYIFIFLHLIFIPFSDSHIFLPPHARGGVAFKRYHGPTEFISDSINTQTFWYDQQVDHFSTDESTYSQKYLLVDTFFTNPNGPVLVLLGAEAGVGDSFNIPYMIDLAKQFNALILSPEHRFYGESMPALDFSVYSLKFLNSKQALSDYATFLTDFREIITNKYGGEGKNKYIIFGGSYGGSLVAWFMLHFPHIAAGAIASSGPLPALVDFYQYDQHIAQVVGPECADILRQTTQEIDNLYFGDNESKEYAKSLFSVDYEIEDRDFVFLVADSMSGAVQYGMKDDLCEWMIDAKIPDSSDSLAKSFANFTTTFWGPDYSKGDFYKIENLKKDSCPTRSWLWQICNEFGWFQSAPASNSIRSEFLTIEKSLEMCKEVFGDIPSPNVDYINQIYQGKNIHVKNTIFSTAYDDPWEPLTMDKEHSGSKLLQFIRCKGCGHCVDLSWKTLPEPPTLKKAREEQRKFISTILAKPIEPSWDSKVSIIVFLAIPLVVIAIGIFIYLKKRQQNKLRVEQLELLNKDNKSEYQPPELKTEN